MTSTFDDLLVPPADMSGNGLKRPTDHHDRYELPLNDGSGRTKGHTRTTTISGTLPDGYGIGLIRLRQVLWGVCQRPGLVALLSSVASDDKAVIDQAIAEGEQVAGMNEKSNLGTATHNVLQRFDQGEPIEALPEYFHLVIQDYERELKHHGLQVIPEWIECTCRMRNDEIAGTFDNVYREADGTLVMVDKKSGEKALDYPHGIATQLAIYANADEIMDYRTGQYVPMPPVRRDYALVVHVRPEEGTCEIRKVDIRRGLWSVEVALHTREWRRQKHLITPYIAPLSSLAAAPAVPDSSVLLASTPAMPAQPVAIVVQQGREDAGLPDFMDPTAARLAATQHAAMSFDVLEKDRILDNGQPTYSWQELQAMRVVPATPDPQFVAEVANAVLDDAHRRVGSSEPHGVVIPPSVPMPSPQDFGAPASVPTPPAYVPPAVPSGGIDPEVRVDEILAVRKNDKTRLQGWAKTLGCTDLAHHRKWLAEWIVKATPGSTAVEPSSEGDSKINSPAIYGGESTPTAPVPLAETPEQRALRQIAAAETLPRLTEIWTRWTAEHGPGSWTGNVATAGERRAAEITAGLQAGADDCPI